MNTFCIQKSFTIAKTVTYKGSNFTVVFKKQTMHLSTAIASIQCMCRSRADRLNPDCCNLPSYSSPHILTKSGDTCWKYNVAVRQFTPYLSKNTQTMTQVSSHKRVKPLLKLAVSNKSLRHTNTHGSNYCNRALDLHVQVGFKNNLSLPKNSPPSKCHAL